jgi:hypothetical protein
MKCPACDSDVPSGQSACTQCGTLLPSAGEHRDPGPRFASGSPMNPQTGSPNPRTEPLPAWHGGNEGPWNVPPEHHPMTGTDGTPPDSGNATQILGIPAASSIPPDYHQVGWNPSAPGAGQMPAGPAEHNFGGLGAGAMPPPGYHPNGWNQPLPPVTGDTAVSSPDGSTKKNRTMLLAGGIAAAAVLVGGLTYALTQGSSGGKTHTSEGMPVAQTAAQQAAAVDQVLKSGETARGHLPSRLRTCDDVSAGVAGFQQVVRDRQQELSQARALKVDRLQDGSRLRQSMIAAYQSSLQADRAYLAWAQKVQARGCGGRIAPLTAQYKKAIAANDKAGPAKRQVVALWKPIAGSHGLPTYPWNRL